MLPLVSGFWTTSAGQGQNPRKQKDTVWSSTPVLLKTRGTQPQGNCLTPASLVTTPPDTTATHGAANLTAASVTTHKHTHRANSSRSTLSPDHPEDGRFPREWARRSAILLCHHTGFQVCLVNGHVKLTPVQSCKHMKEGTLRETTLGQALLLSCQPWNRNGVLGLDWSIASSAPAS